MTTKNITVIGSLNYDVVTTSSRIPQAGETITATNFETHNGGKGSNQALACAKLRADRAATAVRLVGCVGADTFGDNIKAFLTQNGVNVGSVRTVGGGISTGVATILVDAASGQNRILVYPGANAAITETDITQALSSSSGGDVVVLQNEIPIKLVEHAIRTASASNSTIVYNPSPINSDFDISLYHHVSCLLVNSIEAAAIVAHEPELAQLITRDDDAEQALAAIGPIAQYLGLPRHIIITLGAQGCVYLDNSAGAAANQPVHIPAKKPANPIIDTTGAGDTFLGGITAQLAEGNDLSHAVNVALSASAIAITRNGAGDSIPDYSELAL
jgi:ribokinase